MKSRLRIHKLEILTGITAFTVLFLVFCFSGIISLAGEKSILTSDMYGQYYDFLIGIRRIILKQESLLYSWNLDMGIGLIGWIAYYVASPFNLILLFVPENHMIVGITFLLLLKLTSSAVTCSICFKRGFHQKGMECVLFPLCYCLSSYAITYFFNIMWLDILILLPLLVLTLKELIDKGKWTAFVIVLVFAFLSNYYMSFMAGIFLFTCFVAYYVYSNGTLLTKKCIALFIKFVGCAVLAVGVCSILVIPTIYQMMERLGEGTVSTVNGFFQFDIMDFFQSATIGSFTSLKTGNPLIYCSCVMLILIPMYFCNNKISKREKWCIGVLFLVWFLIMAIPILDLMMHIGNNPTWFPYRYAFVFVFLECLIGAREFPYILHEKQKKLLIYPAIMTIFFVFVLILLENVDIKTVANEIGIMVSVLFVLCYSILFYLIQTKKWKKDCVTLLCFCLVTELFLNGVVLLKQIDRESACKSADDIAERQEFLLNQLKEIPEDKDMVRIEKNYRVCYNDGFAYGYNSLSSFSSVYNQGVHRFMTNMGIVNQLWNSSFQGSTTFTNSILGIKYILHATSRNHMILSSGEEGYIETNEYSLPIGFMVNEGVLTYSLENSNSLSPFEQQGKLLTALTGDEKSKDCFTVFEPDNIVYHNVKRTLEDGKTVYQKEDDRKEGSFSYLVSGDGEKEYYFYPQFDYHENTTKYVEITTKYNSGVDSVFTEPTNASIPFNIRLFDAIGATNDAVTFTFLQNEILRFDNEIFYSFDKIKYQKYYEMFREHKLNLSKFDDGFFKGTVNVGEKNDILFLSVPYNIQWNIYVDGKKVKVIPLCSESYMGVRLSEGEHVIVAQYEQKYLKESTLISLISIILLVVLAFHSVAKSRR